MGESCCNITPASLCVCVCDTKSYKHSELSVKALKPDCLGFDFTHYLCNLGDGLVLFMVERMK